MKNTLTIISVPNQRQLRVLMVNHVLVPLLKMGDVVIVSPFSSNPDFRSQFRHERLTFVEWKDSLYDQPFLTRLYNISEMLRVRGYWFRHRKNGMIQYLLRNSVLKHGDGNTLTKLPLWKRIVYCVVSIIGLWSRAWRVLEYVIAPKCFFLEAATVWSIQYSQIKLIQSSSWGMQDRMLSWNARRHKWKSIMLPYTTDQLYMNGYLMADFDVVCVQGPIEEEYAKNLHGLETSKLVRLGSSWFRMLDNTRVAKTKSQDHASSGKTIMYAGSNREFFSLESEFRGLDMLVEAIELNELDDVRIVYRPVPQSVEIQDEIQRRYSNKTNIDISYPDNYAVGLEKFVMGVGLELSVLEHAKRLADTDLMIMCFITSLCLEAAYFNVPTISYCVDETGYLKARHTGFVFEGEFAGLSHIPVITKENEYIPLVRSLLRDDESAQRNYQSTVAKWDFSSKSFNDEFQKVVA